MRPTAYEALQDILAAVEGTKRDPWLALRVVEAIAKNALHYRHATPGAPSATAPKPAEGVAPETAGPETFPQGGPAVEGAETRPGWFRAGMEEAARICDDRARRYRANGTALGPIHAAGADGCAHHIRKAAEAQFRKAAEAQWRRVMGTTDEAR